MEGYSECLGEEKTSRPTLPTCSSLRRDSSEDGRKRDSYERDNSEHTRTMLTALRSNSSVSSRLLMSRIKHLTRSSLPRLLGGQDRATNNYEHRQLQRRSKHK